jgi:hypothetical protein
MSRIELKQAALGAHTSFREGARLLEMSLPAFSTLALSTRTEAVFRAGSLGLLCPPVARCSPTCGHAAA